MAGFGEDGIFPAPARLPGRPADVDRIFPRFAVATSIHTHTIDGAAVRGVRFSTSAAFQP